jgi:hypothetical protein
MARSMVNAAQIEHAIEFPSANQAELFLEFEWLVPIWETKPWSQTLGSNFSVQYLFTSQDRIDPIRIENQKGRQFETPPYSLTTNEGWERCRPMTYQPAIERCELVPVRGEVLPMRSCNLGNHSCRLLSFMGGWGKRLPPSSRLSQNLKRRLEVCVATCVS